MHNVQLDGHTQVKEMRQVAFVLCIPDSTPLVTIQHATFDRLPVSFNVATLERYSWITHLLTLML